MNIHDVYEWTKYFGMSCKVINKLFAMGNSLWNRCRRRKPKEPVAEARIRSGRHFGKRADSGLGFRASVDLRIPKVYGTILATILAFALAGWHDAESSRKSLPIPPIVTT